MFNNKFINGLQENQIEKIRECPKGDLHNHISRGGNINDYLHYFGEKHIDLPSVFEGLDDMEKWYTENIKFRFTSEMYMKRIIWGFKQMQRDGIKLAIATFGLSELNEFESFEKFIEFIKKIKKQIIPDTVLIPELGLPSDCDIKSIVKLCTELFEVNFFKSIDVSGNEMSNPIRYLPVYESSILGRFPQSSTIRSLISSGFLLCSPRCAIHNCLTFGDAR